MNGKTMKMKKAVEISISLIMVMFLVLGIFYTANVLAAPGEGTAMINSGASVAVEISSSTVFTVVLTVGASGIATDADSPIFTIPTGFTAPDAAGDANLGDVDAAGESFVAGAGGPCAVTMGSSSAAGEVITVDVIGAGAAASIAYPFLARLWEGKTL